MTGAFSLWNRGMFAIWLGALSSIVPAFYAVAFIMMSADK